MCLCARAYVGKSKNTTTVGRAYVLPLNIFAIRPVISDTADRALSKLYQWLGPRSLHENTQTFRPPLFNFTGVTKVRK